MPLETAAPGTPGFGRNIKEMVESGHSQKQAIAAAYQAAKGDSTMPDLPSLLAKADAMFQRADAVVDGDNISQMMTEAAREVKRCESVLRSAKTKGEEAAAIKEMNSARKTFQKWYSQKDSDCAEADAGEDTKLWKVTYASGSVVKVRAKDMAGAKARAKEISPKLDPESVVVQDDGNAEADSAPSNAFLKPSTRQYRVKRPARDGVMEYDPALLASAAADAYADGEEDLAREAETLKEREFGAKADADYKSFKVGTKASWKGREVTVTGYDNGAERVIVEYEKGRYRTVDPSELK